MQKLYKKIYITIMALVMVLAVAPIQPDALAESTVILKEGDEGDAVINLQERLADLNYFNYKITNYFGSYTKKRLAEFQKQNGLSADGVLGQETYDLLYSNQAKRAKVDEKKKPRVSSGSSSSTSGTTKKTGKLLNWWTDVRSIFAVGETAKVYDVETGITFYVKRYGGTNHADVEPTSASSTAAMKKARGGEWSWERRAIVVRIDGIYIAASMNGQPHGGYKIKDNNFPGHFCIHFYKSKTHINDAMCPDHQRMVKKAAGK